MAKLSATAGEEAFVADEEARHEEEVEDGNLELQSQEELAAGPEDIAPLKKRKRSSTMKRCSAVATGMTFVVSSTGNSALGDEGGSIDDVETASETPNEVEDNDQDGLESEKGNDGNGDRDNGGGAWHTGWSDGLAGEEMSMERILEKARKMVAEVSSAGNSSTKPTKEKKRSSDHDLTGIDDQIVKKPKEKKEDERIRREEIYAESQRLLRESKGVAFVAPNPVIKPVSSVLEKIRQRRLQLGCSTAGSTRLLDVEMKLVSQQETKDKSSAHVDLRVDDDTEVEIQIFSSTVVETEEVGDDVQVHHNSTQGVSRDKEDVQIAEADGKVQDDTASDDKTPGTPESQKELVRADLASSRSDEKDSTNQCILDTQDLLCTSQLSPETEESLEPTPPELVVVEATDLMGLNTELQDEDLMPRLIHGDHHKESKEIFPRLLGQSEVYTKATHVRGLIDDEAEDDDEDILAENAEEEDLGDEEDLQDLIVSTEKEKAGDKARRDALHRKWLAQQDTEQTEDILERLRTGRSTRWQGRDRVVSCLDEDDDLVHTTESEFLDKNNSSSQAGASDPFGEEDLIEKPSISLRERMRSQNLEMDCLLDEHEDPAREEPLVEDDEFIDDEEEYERSIIRKRLLEESEEQLAFMSPADSESSREVLGLINKVNVGTLKTKSTSGQLEIRALGGATSSSLPSRPSFLGRSVSSLSAPPPAHRQVGSGGSSGGSSRSFVFGLDDSNSSHALPSNQSQGVKKPGAAKVALNNGVSSLFEMLKKQAKEINQDGEKSTSAVAKKWGSNTEAFSVFATKKTVTSSRHKL